MCTHKELQIIALILINKQIANRVCFDSYITIDNDTDKL